MLNPEMVIFNDFSTYRRRPSWKKGIAEPIVITNSHDPQQLNYSFETIYADPLVLPESPPEESNFNLELLGRFMVNFGRVLIIPEPVDATNPYTWIDELIGGVFILVGLTLIAVP